MDYKTKEPGGQRSSIWLSEPIRTWIETEAKKNNTSSAEVIRAAIRELKQKVERQEAKTKAADAIQQETR